MNMACSARLPFIIHWKVAALLANLQYLVEWDPKAVKALFSNEFGFVPLLNELLIS